MKKMTPFSGFSLVEMAMVLFIVGLLLAGLLPMISSQMEQQQRTETRKQIEEIRAALLGFAVVNGRLPCPDTTGDGNEDTAAPTITNNIPMTGQSTRKTACSANAGGLPFNQLGVAPADNFGSNYIYAITLGYGEKNEIFSAVDAGGTLLNTTFFSLSTVGTIKICKATTDASTACPTPRLTDNAAAILISKGANWALAPSIEEIENSDGDSDFISHDNTPSFDDLVVWLSPNTLFNRMVAAGKLP